MDRETRHELDRLYRSFCEALRDVRTAPDDDAELTAWKRVQTTTWELHEMLPAMERSKAG